MREERERHTHRDTETETERERERKTDRDREWTEEPGNQCDGVEKRSRWAKRCVLLVSESWQINSYASRAAKMKSLTTGLPLGPSSVGAAQ